MFCSLNVKAFKVLIGILSSSSEIQYPLCFSGIKKKNFFLGSLVFRYSLENADVYSYDGINIVCLNLFNARQNKGNQNLND